MQRKRIILTGIILVMASLACNLSTNGNQSRAATSVSGSQPQATLEPLFSAPGLKNIQLKTDVQSVGPKPLFQWQAVPDAAHYQLILYDASGAPYWAWDGTGTQIYLGGGDTQPSADSAGPTLEAGSSWAVIAFDASGKVIATSDVQSISP